MKAKSKQTIVEVTLTLSETEAVILREISSLDLAVEETVMRANVGCSKTTAYLEEAGGVSGFLDHLESVLGEHVEFVQED